MNWWRRFSITALFLFLLAALARFGFAADISGKVYDDTGGGVAGAEVIAREPSGDFSATTLTGDDGSYSLESVPEGVYTLTVRKSGFPDLVQERISTATNGEDLQLDLRMLRRREQASLEGTEELNPNVFVVKLDTNELLRGLDTRGADVRFLQEFRAQENNFGAEHGRPLKTIPLTIPRPPSPRFHGSLYEFHQNSALNARSFFTVGELLPSRRNQYGATVGGPVVSERVSFDFAWSQNRESGFVNGNVLAPLGSERIPRSDDPATNAVIAGLLQGFPEQLPNLPNVSRRQLNTNARRDIRSTGFSSRLDFHPRPSDRFAFEQRFLDSTEEPFQIVTGQNPVTLLRPQSFHLTHSHTVSPNTITRAAFNFDRLSVALDVTEEYRNLLAPLGIQVVPEVTFGQELNGLGPGSSYPRRRVENRFHFSPEITHVRGNHTLAAGFAITRYQINDLQSDNSRGVFAFSRDFGRTAVDNFLLGRASSFTITLGDLYRGFRNWETNFYFQDTVRVAPRWTLSLGLRYEAMTAPVEVNGRTAIAYRTDANNFAPQFGFAWNPGGGKTVVRGGYGIAFGSLFPVLYQRARFNPPAVRTISVDSPDLLDPLRGVDLAASENPRTELQLLSPDLVAPYSHLYNFGIEQALPAGVDLRIGYVGSRTLKLPTRSVSNRARPVPGIPTTTATINQRRPDPAHSAINTVSNLAIGYLDALHVAANQRLAHGLAWKAEYSFSKAINSGDTHFAQIGTGFHRSTIEDVVGDLRGLSRFDTPHMLTVSYSYEFPWGRGRQGARSLFLGGWKISGTSSFRSGTPTHAHTGSDSPGFGNVDGVAGDRPNLLNPAILWKSLDHPDTSPLIFRPEYFDTIIPPGGRGNLGYETFRNDGTHNWNFALEKEFPFREGGGVQFRSEFYNLFNMPQFDEVNHAVANETFGQITNTANKGRVIQFLLRVRL